MRHAPQARTATTAVAIRTFISENGGQQRCRRQDHLPDPARGEREQREQEGLQGVIGEAEAAVVDADRGDGADGDVPHEHAPQREGGAAGQGDIISAS